ncbi:hypothetical protein [Natrinema gari]|uniref:Uncharacterized protein n=1 Tax=Natrinema gari JCM 14663 TaxID=1230459 RepID=L9YX13_9EURY|nr:hypothetical protein [Natrinema gari]ELY77448.1 hypothetical protein C486_15129 [Natrinema gari JCM 14663]
MSSTVQSRLAAYFPDRSPTWIDLLIGILTGVEIGPDILSPATISWPAAVSGFLVFTIALGPGSNSSLGRWVSQWFRSIGILRRVVVIVLFALTVGIVSRFDAVPNAQIADAASGGLLATFLYLVTYIVWAGGVSDWESNRENGN